MLDDWGTKATIISSPRAVMFRLLHDNPAGGKLVAAASSTNEILAANREAQATFAECRAFFDTDIKDIFPKSGKDDEASSFAAWTKELTTKCNLFSFVASDANLRESGGKQAVESFYKLCERCLPDLEYLLVERVVQILEKFGTDCVINVSDPAWVAVKEEIPFLLQQAMLFCKDSSIHLLLERVKKVQHVEEPQPLRQGVDCCLAFAKLAAWSNISKDSSEGLCGHVGMSKDQNQKHKQVSVSQSSFKH